MFGVLHPAGYGSTWRGVAGVGVRSWSSGSSGLPMLHVRRLAGLAVAAIGRESCREVRHLKGRPLSHGVGFGKRRLAVASALEREPSSTIVQERLEQHGIVLESYEAGQKRVICPKCDGGSSREVSLAILVEDRQNATWLCHRGTCGFTGGTRASGAKKQNYSNGAAAATASAPAAAAAAAAATAPVKREISLDNLNLKPVTAPILLNFFSKRKISKATVDRNGVMQQGSGEYVAAAFVYRRNKQIVACKFRRAQKKFTQVPGCERILYGLDDIKGQSEIVIVEGEMDKLAMDEAGIRHCVSVPDGAPPKVSEQEVPPPMEDRKYQYLWNCKDYFAKATKIVLATDNDVPGQALAEELARRLGRERCWRVKWPEFEGKACKDANEVLANLGKEDLVRMVAEAEVYPIRGLLQFSQFFKEIEDYYYLRLGDERGISTGWTCLDEVYRVVPGELTVVTGVPNSGKSEWIDALLCNLNHQRQWSFALCSMENKVREHARKLLEKHMQKPFFDAPYANSMPRMTPEDLAVGKQWLNDNFYLIRHEDDQLPSITWVLDLARAAVMRYGIRGLVIDPYNELDHQRPSSQTETEYVSQMLTKVKRFAQHHDCHVWFVAHPKQLQVWRGEAPGLYDISGSAHFVNKCDNGIVIHRNRDPEAGPLDRVQVLVRKVRNKAAGTIGDAYLQYNKATGEYRDTQGDFTS